MFVAHAMTRADCGPLLYVARDERSARQLISDVSFFCGRQDLQGTSEREIVMLGEIDTSPYADVAADPRFVAARMAALHRLQDHDAPPRLVVASLRSLTRTVLSKATFEARTRTLAQGQSVDRDEILALLVDAGYERVEVVEDPGTFAVRGYVVDVFVPSGRFPYRLEWFGDELEQVRTFDPATQRSLRRHEALAIHPARETMVTDMAGLRAKILRLGDELQLPSRVTRGVHDSLRAGIDFFGREGLTPLMHREMSAPWSYLPDETTWLVEEPEELRMLYARMRESYDAQRAASVEAQQLTAPPEGFFVSEEVLQDKLDGAVLKFTATAGERSSEVEAPAGRDRLIRVFADSNLRLKTHLDGARARAGGDVITPLAEHLSGLGRGSDGIIERPWDVVLVAANPTQRKQLVAMLETREIDVAPPEVRAESRPEFLELSAPSEPGGASRVRVVVGALTHGFTSEEDRVLVLAESELFGLRTRKHRKGSGTRRAGNLAQLSVGDFVVHYMHGIGLYSGIVRMTINSVMGDFVQVDYAGSDKLFLPVHRVGEIERFSSSADRTPKLDKLGGHTFEVRARKVKADVRQMADELLQIYADREVQRGFSHPVMEDLCTQFDQTFPFEETEDQLEAIEAVAANLSDERPMDRIICGDVGFGKTEVALRAAFRVAAAGKQVAVLAPTTVLVQQHFLTFCDRMSMFPLRVGCLNRFQSTENRREVVAGIRSGAVDVVVGTHRLLSADVRFKDLGLVIIDEEQRFGVRQKERFKKLKTEVDVLTLTATPIPRTLHLSLLGVREISMISTPPLDRLAVRTYLTRSSDVVLQQGIRRELGRGGQVFVVMPRVLGIEEQAQRIRELAPDARVQVAHGQMPSKLLESTMIGFVEHQIDILVCTTIIESGLDIPRANTMFIERADMFGMAQLHQLRGRIGRGRLRAHCYLLVNSLERLTEEAKRRLEGVVRHGHLGAGFNVATRDLEIRGAGDILGKRQSGAIQSVGFEAYARLLKEAVAELRGAPISRDEDTELSVDVPAFLPDDYIVDTGQRLDVYRRLARAKETGEVDEVMDELRDRYGDLPSAAAYYGVLIQCRVVARRLGAIALELRGARLTLRWPSGRGGASQSVREHVAADPGRFKMQGDAVLRIALGAGSPGGVRGTLSECYEMLVALPAP